MGKHRQPDTSTYVDSATGRTVVVTEEDHDKGTGFGVVTRHGENRYDPTRQGGQRS